MLRDCRHDMVVRRIDELGPMTTDPATGLTSAPVTRSHYECLECRTRLKVVVDQGAEQA